MSSQLCGDAEKKTLFINKILTIVASVGCQDQTWCYHNICDVMWWPEVVSSPFAHPYLAQTWLCSKCLRKKTFNISKRETIYDSAYAKFNTTYGVLGVATTWYLKLISSQLANHFEIMLHYQSSIAQFSWGFVVSPSEPKRDLPLPSSTSFHSITQPPIVVPLSQRGCTIRGWQGGAYFVHEACSNTAIVHG